MGILFDFIFELLLNILFGLFFCGCKDSKQNSSTTYKKYIKAWKSKHSSNNKKKYDDEELESQNSNEINMHVIELQETHMKDLEEKYPNDRV